MHEIRNVIELVDVTDGGAVRLYHVRVEEGATSTAAEHTGDVLPPEFLTLFDGVGSVPVADLTAEERDWINAEADQIEVAL